MTAQSSYSFYQSIPFAGVLADLASDIDIRSYVNQDVVGLPFGIGVAQGTDDNGCILQVDINSKVLGITTHTHAVDPYFLPTSPTTAGVPLKGTVGVLKKGRIFAIAEVAVVPGDIVTSRYTAGSGFKTQVGSLGNSTDSSSALQITQAAWSTTAAAGAVGIADINMP